MFKITDDNYKDYKKIFEIICDVLYKDLFAKISLQPEHSPIAVLSAWEKKSMSLAKRGLREGLRDSLSRISATRTASSSINQINDQLAAHNLPSINKLIATLKDIPAKVLKRGRINNLDEYYVIKEILCDVDYDLPNADKIRLDKIFFDFEFKKDNSQKAR